MIIIMIKELEYIKQVMHNSITHHSPADAQPHPEQQPSASFPHSLCAEHDEI